MIEHIDSILASGADLAIGEYFYFVIDNDL